MNRLSKMEVFLIRQNTIDKVINAIEEIEKDMIIAANKRGVDYQAFLFGKPNEAQHYIESRVLKEIMRRIKEYEDNFIDGL